MRTSLFIVLVIVLLALCGSPAQEQERGWLAQRQMQARQDCAELIKYRMQW